MSIARPLLVTIAGLLVVACAHTAPAPAPPVLVLDGDLDTVTRRLLWEVRREQALDGFSPILVRQAGEVSIQLVQSHAPDRAARVILTVRLVETAAGVQVETEGRRFDGIGRSAPVDLDWAIEPLMARAAAPAPDRMDGYPRMATAPADGRAQER